MLTETIAAISTGGTSSGINIIRISGKNAKNIINVIENIDLEYILLETDSPYMTPEPFRKYKNDSSYIPVIANKIADIKGISVSLVEKTTRDNANRLFDI